MSALTLRTTAISGWLILILVAVGVGLANGAAVTWGSGTLALLAAVLPVLVVLTVFRGAPPRTVGQVIYEEEHRSAVADRLRELEERHTRS